MLERIAAIGIFPHSSSTTSTKTSWETFSFLATIALTLFSTPRLRIAQIFSIGLRSGLYEGHGRTRRRSRASRSSFTSFDVCLGRYPAGKPIGVDTLMSHYHIDG